MVGDPAKAEWVTRVLGIVFPEPPHAAELPHEAELQVKLEKCRKLWHALTSTIEAKKAELKTAIVQKGEESGTYYPDELADLEEDADRVDELVEEFEAPIEQEIGRVVHAPPGPAREEAKQELLEFIADLQQFVAKDTDFALFDNNEYLSTGVKAIAEKALAAIRHEVELV